MAVLKATEKFKTQLKWLFHFASLKYHVPYATKQLPWPPKIQPGLKLKDKAHAAQNTS
jgi:hypothetical protein